MSERRGPDDTGGPRPSAVKKAGGTKRRAKTAAATDVAKLSSTPPEPAVQNVTRTLSSTQGARTVPQRPRSKGDEGGNGKKVRPVLKLLNGLLTLLVVIVLGVVGTGYYLHAAVDAEGPLKEAKLLVIPRNDGTQQIAEKLEKDGMVSDRRLFLAGLYTLRGASLMPGGRTINLKAGEYEIKPGASIRTIIDTMSEGRSVLMRVTVPEGLTSFQIVERLKSDAALTGEIKDVPAEGTLLPETYSLPRGSTRQTLIEMMQAAQKKLVDQLWAERYDNLPLKTTAEALVLASIVEKETGRNDERDRVSAVFVNRLRKGMKIQSDPTILYGLALGKVQWGKPILRSEIQSKTAHNTYVIPALPPTPICNPGRAAIEATLKPATVNDLFFVADGKGGHVFAETNRDHEANVAKWRQVERDRAGVAASPAQAPAPITSTINGKGPAALAPGAKVPAKGN
jgi:UPF0755 protein